MTFSSIIVGIAQVLCLLFVLVAFMELMTTKSDWSKFLCALLVPCLLYLAANLPVIAG